MERGCLRSPGRLRRLSVLASLLAVATLAACSGSGSSSTGATASPVTGQRGSTTTTSSPATTTDDEEAEPATTARRATTSTGRTGGSAPSAASTCALLSTADVENAVGIEPDRASPARSQGCRWEQGTDPLVDVDVEAPDDAAHAFRTSKTLYADPSKADLVEGLGDEAYVHGLDQKVVFRKGERIWTVWVQATPSSGTKVDAAVALARLVEPQV